MAGEVEDFSLVAIGFGWWTQGDAGTRLARSCLPWTTVCNAVGVKIPKDRAMEIGHLLCKAGGEGIQSRMAIGQSVPRYLWVKILGSERCLSERVLYPPSSAHFWRCC